MPIEVSTPDFPEPQSGHEHIWDKWYPQDNKTIRRVCLDPMCNEVEKKEVRG